MHAWSQIHRKKRFQVWEILKNSIPLAAEQNLTEKSIHKSPKKVQELIGFHNQFLTQKANLIG